MMTLDTRPLLTISMQVEPPVTMGELHGQTRRYIPLGHGTVSGAFAGKVIAGGADWQMIRADGVLEISAHYMLERHDGARLEVRSDGLRAATPEVMAQLARGELLPASAYYFRTHMRFATTAPDLDHFNRLLAVSVGERRSDSVHLEIFEIL
jgi:Protein of unknown function (DUF3237)